MVDFKRYIDPVLQFSIATTMILSFMDSVLTLNIIEGGGSEANPVMEYFMAHSIEMFAWVKMMTTGVALVFLAYHADVELFGRVKVRTLVLSFTPAYILLIAYELFILTYLMN